jgi:hypothetical protein
VDCEGLNYNQANDSCGLLNIINIWDNTSLITGLGTEGQQFFMSAAGVYTSVPAVVSSPGFMVSSPVR